MPTPDGSASKVMCASSKPSHRLVSGNHALYVASLAQNRIRSQCSPAGNARGISVALFGQADRVQHAVGQHVVRFGVDAHRAHRGTAPDHRAAVARAVGEAADDAVGPARFSLVALEDRHRRHAELTERDPGAVPDGDELVAPLGNRLGDQRLLFGQRREVRAGRSTPRNTPERRPACRAAPTTPACRAVIVIAAAATRSRNCAACAFISGVITK